MAKQDNVTTTEIDPDPTDDDPVCECCGGHAETEGDYCEGDHCPLGEPGQSGHRGRAPARPSPTRLTTDDLESMRIGSVVYVASVLVSRVPYKRTRKGWCTFAPGSGRANGKPLTSETIAERGAWTR